MCNRSSTSDPNQKEYVVGNKTCSTQLLNTSEAHVTPHTSRHHQNSGQGNAPVLSETPSNVGIVAPFAVTGPLLHSNEYEQGIDDSCTDSDNDEVSTHSRVVLSKEYK